MRILFDDEQSYIAQRIMKHCNVFSILCSFLDVLSRSQKQRIEMISDSTNSAALVLKFPRPSRYLDAQS